MRDALSLTDQAIAHGAGAVTAQAVRDMLGLADRVRIIDLFEYLMKGDAAAALKELRDQYVVGADPAVVLADLADFTHLVTTLRFVPDAAEDAALSPMEAERGLEFSKSLSIRTLGQVWQMLLKALEETRNANAPRQAAEMALIRIAHAADLPSPDDLVRMIRSGEIGDLPAAAGSNGAAGHGQGGGAGASGSGGPAAAATAAIAAPSAQGSASVPSGGPQSSGLMSARMGGGQSSRPQIRPAVEEAPPEVEITTLEQLVALAESKRDSLMTVSIRRYLQLVKMVPGRLEVALTTEAPRTLITDLTRKLHDWTGRRWVVTISNGEAKPTLDEAATARRNTLLLDAESDPEVAAILASFPGAKVVDVRLRGDAEAAADDAALVSDVVEDDILVDPSELSDDDDI